MFKDAGFLARLHQELQLLRRMQCALARSRLQPTSPQDQIAEAVECEDCRAQQEKKQSERAHDPQRRAFATLQGKALWREFAQHDVQGRDDDEGNRHRNRVRAEGNERFR